MQVKIRVRSGTSEEWAAKDPVLLLAEPGYDSTTRTLKIGDGASKWSELPTTVTTDQIEEAVANSAAVHNGVHGASHAGEGVDAIPAKTLTAARDLNTLTTTGVYIQGSSAGTTIALGYPVDGFAGEVTVTAQSSGAMVMQRATYFLGTSALFGSWIRTRYSNTWSPWTRVAMAQDTGWRVVTSWTHTGVVTGEPLPANLTPQSGLEGFIRWRRENNDVTLSLKAITVTSGSQVPIPPGFAPALGESPIVPVPGVTGGVPIGAAHVYLPTIPSPTQGYTYELRWRSRRPWPTTLPGAPG